MGYSTNQMAREQERLPSRRKITRHTEVSPLPHDTDREWLDVIGRPDFLDWIGRFLMGVPTEPDWLPWVRDLDSEEKERLCRDLRYILSEPEETGEPLDVHEIREILREYADIAGWSGPLIGEPLPLSAPPLFRVDVRPREIRALRSASVAVQKAVQSLLAGFLALHPTDGARLETGEIKKMSDRDIWQIDLPNGYRLRYFVDDRERVVYVVYLGPHPDGQADGRERAVLAAINRRRNGG